MEIFYGHHCGGADAEPTATVFKLSRQSDGTWVETILHAFFGKRRHRSTRRPAEWTLTANLFGTTVGGGQLRRKRRGFFELQPQPGGIYSFAVIHHFHFDGIHLLRWRSARLHATPRQCWQSLRHHRIRRYWGRVHTTGPPARPARALPRQFPAGCGTVFKLTPQSNGFLVEENSL